MADTAEIKFKLDDRELTVPPGTLVIEAARQQGIEVPSFCYYEGLALQAACRMCLVQVEKAPRLTVARTPPVAEGMVVRTESEQVRQARKYTLEFLLTNHPLDCPVCDKGGECELQDMVFRYGAGESRYTETKLHVDEKQWSPVVYFDAPRCILCYRCVRICNEGMGVGALGIVNRGVISEIGSNRTTNEENYYLQKFARQGLGTSNIDHHRSGDLTTLLDAISGKFTALATVADLYTAKASLVIGADLAEQQPLLAFQLRANFRHHAAHTYTVTAGPVRERKYALASLIAPPGEELKAV